MSRAPRYGHVVVGGVLRLQQDWWGHYDVDPEAGRSRSGTRLLDLTHLVSGGERIVSRNPVENNNWFFL